MRAIKYIFCTGICECLCHTHPYVHFCMIMIWIRQELMEMTTRRCHLGLLGYVSGTWRPKSSEENSYSSQNTSDIRPDYVANIRTANRLHTQVSVFVFFQEISKIDILFHCGVHFNVWSGIPIVPIDNDTKFDKTATDYAMFWSLKQVPRI